MAKSISFQNIKIINKIFIISYYQRKFENSLNEN